ncbi:MAG: hypothetical protein WC365_10405, partial [Candidatus Babeliales bacterium]
MEFIFYCLANNGDELVSKVGKTLEAFFANDKWNYSLLQIEQVKQEPTVKRRLLFFKTVVQPTQILFQIKVEVFSKGLNNALVSAR